MPNAKGAIAPEKPATKPAASKQPTGITLPEAEYRSLNESTERIRKLEVRHQAASKSASDLERELTTARAGRDAVMALLRRTHKVPESHELSADNRRFAPAKVMTAGG